MMSAFPWMNQRKRGFWERCQRRLLNFFRWATLLTYKRVFISFNAEYISKAEIASIDWSKMRINALVFRNHDPNSHWCVWDVDKLTKKQFEELRTMIEEAKQDAPQV